MTVFDNTSDAGMPMIEKNADAYRTIGEAAEELNLPQHVLRFWETRFSQISPMKRSGGRRYYRPADVQLLAAIQHLLYGEGYTIKGVQRILKQQGTKAIVDMVNQLQAAGVTRDLPFVVDGGDGSTGHTNVTADTASDSGARVIASTTQARQLQAPGEEDATARNTADVPSARVTTGGAGRLPDHSIKLLQEVLRELEECSQALESARGH